MKRIGRGIKRLPGVMNKLELRYESYLKEQKHLGYVEWFEFESIKLKLATKTFYTPDFLVMRPDGEVEVHEVKGFWEQHARIKIKVAAAKFPFRFFAVKLEKGIWAYEEL